MEGYEDVAALGEGGALKHPRYARGAPLKPAWVVLEEEVVMCCVNSFL